MFDKMPTTMKSGRVLDALRRSDHASFWDADFPAIQLTDTAEYRNDHYHCKSGPDTPSDLDHAFAVQIIRATVGSVAALLGSP